MVGSIYIIGSFALSKYTSSEAGTGKLTTNVAINNDTGASVGTYVNFSNKYYWMINDGKLSNVIKAGLSLTLLNYFFNNSRTLLRTGSSILIDNQLPNPQKVKKMLLEQTYQPLQLMAFLQEFIILLMTMKLAILRHKMNKNCPIDYAIKAETIVHNEKLFFIFTPGTHLAPNINSSLGCQTILGTGSSNNISSQVRKYTDFLNKNFASLVALHTDILEIQKLQHQVDSVGFNYFTCNSVDQAKTATSSKTPILIGIKTDDVSHIYTLRQLFVSYNWTKLFAASYWLNIPAT